MTVTDIGNWLLVLLTVTLWAFTLIYAFRSRWWTNEVGRVLLPEKLLTCLVLTQVSVSAVTSAGYPGRDPLRIALYAACTLSAVALTIVLVRIQKRERNTRSDHDDTEGASDGHTG